MQWKWKMKACIIMNIQIQTYGPLFQPLKSPSGPKTLLIFSESNRHEDRRQKLTFQPHVCSEGSQSNRPRSGLLPAIPAPQRQSADWQEVTDDGGRKLGQPTGTRFWTGEHVYVKSIPLIAITMKIHYWWFLALTDHHRPVHLLWGQGINEGSSCFGTWSLCIVAHQLKRAAPSHL